MVGEDFEPVAFCCCGPAQLLSILDVFIEEMMCDLQQRIFEISMPDFRWSSAVNCDGVESGQTNHTTKTRS